MADPIYMHYMYLYYVSFSTLFCWSVQNKDSKYIFRNCYAFTYVRVKLPRLTLFPRVKRGLTVCVKQNNAFLKEKSFFFFCIFPIRIDRRAM